MTSREDDIELEQPAAGLRGRVQRKAEVAAKLEAMHQSEGRLVNAGDVDAIANLIVWKDLKLGQARHALKVSPVGQWVGSSQYLVDNPGGSLKKHLGRNYQG